MRTNKPKYKLVVDHVVDGISSGTYKRGDWIPSVNEFCKMFNMARGTVFTAFNELRSRSIIDSTPGVGYYISTEEIAIKRKIFLLFNEFNIFKEDLYNSFASSVSKNASIDLFFHNYNRNVFDVLLHNAEGKYTHYIIMPGKFKNIDGQLQKLGGRVFLLDHFTPDLKTKYSSVGQNFEMDTYNALVFGLDRLRKYRKIIIVQQNLKEPKERYDGLKKFAADYRFECDYIGTVKDRQIEKGEVYLVVDDRDLIFLLRKGASQGLVLGSDFGIISYNETLLKEELAGGITTLSTDFVEMGRTMASLLDRKEIVNIDNRWVLNIRKSI